MGSSVNFLPGLIGGILRVKLTFESVRCKDVIAMPWPISTARMPPARLSIITHVAVLTGNRFRASLDFAPNSDLRLHLDECKGSLAVRRSIYGAGSGG
jgi:hypothetical protein